jgi:hypothetical protein
MGTFLKNSKCHWLAYFTMLMPTNENCFSNWLEHIWFKGVFDLENYEFSKCVFNKSCSCLCDRGHECIIYMI